MSTKKKKVIGASKANKTAKKKVTPTVSRRNKVAAAKGEALVFDKENYKWILIGLGFIVLGMALMSGGAMPSPDVWDDGLIYSFRRVTLAPIVILIGLGIEVYAIFK